MPSTLTLTRTHTHTHIVLPPHRCTDKKQKGRGKGRPTVDKAASGRVVRANVPKFDAAKANTEDSNDDDDGDGDDGVDGVTGAMAALNTTGPSMGSRRNQASDTETENDDDDDDDDNDGLANSNSGSQEDVEATKDGLVDANVDVDALAPAHEYGGPYTGPLEGRNDTVPDEFLMPIGRVVGIVSRKDDQQFPGALEPYTNTRFVRFVPRDSRVPRMVIPIASAPEDFYSDPNKYKRQVYLAKMVAWRANAVNAVGEIVECLGKAGQIVVETDSILKERDIPTEEFSPEVLADLPQIGTHEEWTIPPEEIAQRRDLRAHRIFSIDPLTARDLDDALSCTALGDGTFEVGVHIADVSHFIPQGSALDKEAAHRATSTYMPHTVFPMLPRLLCENLCSLVADVDRLAYSVIWTLDASGKKLSQWIGRTVIRSCGKLAYEHAQAVIEDESVRWSEGEYPVISQPHTVAQVKQDIVNLNR